MIAPALRLDEFSYTYPDGGEPSLRGVSLNIEPGEFALVCGASGSGKSTLLRAAGGLVPHHFGGVAAGEASVRGRDLRTHRAAEMAAVCGTVMQDPEVQVVMGSVGHEIAFPLENLGWDRSAVRVAVEQTALALGIHELLGRRTAELSGGELQRVVLATALAAHPPLLTLDEPASQLDPVAADELLATLARLNADWGTTVLLADHRIERSLKLASRVLVLERGVIVCDEPPREFLAWAAASGRHQLLTPSARLCSLAGLAPLPTGVERARDLIGDAVQCDWPAEDGPWAKEVAPPTSAPAQGSPVLELRSVGFAHARAARRAIDRVDLELRAGDRVALMGANGSGKSTLLRLARGLLKPSAGSVAATGEVALLLQNPNDYLIHERVGEEAPPHALECFGLAGYADRDPRDLSGGERQRLALAIVMQNRPAVLLLDEPTRGMDGERKRDLIEQLVSVARAGTAVVLATHDSESAAAFADRIVLLGDGQVLADGAARELLGAGAQYATATARLLPGSGALTPEQGATWLATRSTAGESLAAGAAR